MKTDKSGISVKQVISGLIEVREGEWDGVSVMVVDAKDLHKFLEVKTEFNLWVRRRIEEYDFQENQDYISLLKNEEQKKQGGLNRKEYELTLEMAKELAMVERTDQGKKVRRYFIACEKALLAGVLGAKRPANYLGMDVVDRFLAGYDDRSTLERLADSVKSAKALAKDLGVPEVELGATVRALIKRYQGIDVEDILSLGQTEKGRGVK